MDTDKKLIEVALGFLGLATQSRNSAAQHHHNIFGVFIASFQLHAVTDDLADIERASSWLWLHGDFPPYHDKGLTVAQAINVQTCKGYEFEKRYADGQPDSWVATHRDYDGAPIDSFGPPADDRCFFGPTLEDVIEQVEEYHADE